MPDPINTIIARQRELVEQADRAREKYLAECREHDKLVYAGNLVSQLGQGYELDLTTGNLHRWVQAMANYKAQLAARGWLDRLAQPPADIAEPDAWQLATEIFGVVDTDPDQAVVLLEQAATVTCLAVSIARVLRRELRQVVEGHLPARVVMTQECAPIETLPNVDEHGLAQAPPAGLQSISFTAEAAAILNVMLAAHPLRLTVMKIEEKVVFVDKTIRKFLQSLLAQGLVEQLEKKKGYSLTLEGLEQAQNLPSDAGVHLLKSARPGR
jgi:hypothetical protein